MARSICAVLAASLVVCFSTHAEEQRPTAGMSSGSGLIVGTQGYVVTNNSVVPACRGVLQVFDGFQISDAAIVARGATNNLAPLKLPTGKSRAVAFGCG